MRHSVSVLRTCQWDSGVQCMHHPKIDMFLIDQNHTLRRIKNSINLSTNNYYFSTACAIQHVLMVCVCNGVGACGGIASTGISGVIFYRIPELLVSCSLHFLIGQCFVNNWRIFRISGFVFFPTRAVISISCFLCLFICICL